MEKRKEPTVTIEAVRMWRQARYEAGKPSGLGDFFRVENICHSCRGTGQRIDGVGELEMSINVCPTCNGDGKYHGPA